MKLSVLTDNQALKGFGAEHGLSFYIEHENTSVLLDAGHSKLFLENAKKLNVDLEKVETIVLSHGHWDHGNGLKFLNNKTLICHPYSFIKRYRNSDHSFIGLNLCYLDLNKKFKLVNTRNPYNISNSIIFLGEIPRTNDFEAKETTFVDEHNKPDYVLDDSALAIIQNNELIIISGCAHSGICNIVEHAKKVTGIQTIKTLLGGLHLKENNTQTQKTITYLKHQKINTIYPSHCTQAEALTELQKNFNCPEIKAGIQINI